MSAMAWLFGLGVLAIGFPLLFHLIRRTPKGQTEFSSLMFLKPTPPTLTRRSRLENILLLLLRAAAICLIAFAFMRPFFRGTDTLSKVDVAHRRVAILLDTSASMQRAGLWDQARQQVETVLDGLEEGDDVALLAFDNRLNIVENFHDDVSRNDIDRAKRVRDALQSVEPSWARSDLGKAMVTVADQLDLWRDSQRAANADAVSKLQIVVISDLQEGSRVDSLQSYQWPAHVFVKFQTVIPADLTNATVQLLAPVPEEEDPSLRIRVANSEDSSMEQFFVNWTSDGGNPNADPISFYVPQGTSRVLKVASDDAVFANRFHLTGDPEEFDNTFFVVPNEQQVLNVVYLGSDTPDDPERPQFYLRRAMIETPSRRVNVRQFSEGIGINDQGGLPPTLVVLASPASPSHRAQIAAYLESGGTLLVVLSDIETVESTTDWTGARTNPLQPDRDESKSEYQMLANIDFSNQLFQPFANPRYNDFTKIRFWDHQRIEFIDDESTVIARFENDDPAVWTRSIESGGSVFVLASGWQPQQSQLALSTKFVPLINGLIEIAADFPELDRSLVVGETIEFPAATIAGSKRTLVKPDGAREVVEPEQTRFTDADQPGIYSLESRAGTIGNSVALVGSDEKITSNDPELASESGTTRQTLFAVNVDRSESETSAIPVSKIEMFGVNVGEQESAADELAQMREMRDRDFEDQQKIWKWLIVAAMVLLIGETWLAGRAGAKPSAAESDFQSNGLSGELT